LDGSARSPAVLATAVKLAQSLGGQLSVLRSVGLPPDVPQDFFKTTDQALIDVLCQAARSDLERAVADLPADLLAPDAIEVVVGSPSDSICSAARRLAVDLVVIGSHGYGGIDRLLGTTAARVVNHAPCSVLVVRGSVP
jgi:nucleotide-binding universal stress UspA family protein